MTLNDVKCEFPRNIMDFLGHVISQEGIGADSQKTEAIREFPEPKDVNASMVWLTSSLSFCLT